MARKLLHLPPMDFLSILPQRLQQGATMRRFVPSDVESASPRQSAGEAVIEADEALIVDSRANLRPAQIVEDRLVHSLNQPVVLVSQVRSRGLDVRRSHC